MAGKVKEKSAKVRRKCSEMPGKCPVPCAGHASPLTLPPSHGRLPRRSAPLGDIAARVVIADKGDGAEARVRAPLREAGKVAVIPPKRNRKEQRDDDRDRYATRHRIANFFAKRKQSLGIATRDDKTRCSLLVGVHLAAIATPSTDDTP